MYLDPGFGSMLIQATLAGFAIVGVSLAMFRQKITVLFRQKNHKKTEESDSTVKADDDFEQVD